MGGTTSKPVEEVATDLFKADPNAATYSSSYVQSELSKASAVAKQIQDEATLQAEKLGSQVSGLSAWAWGLSGLSTILFLTGIGLLIYYLLARFQAAGVTTFFGLEVAPTNNTRDLAIHSALLPPDSGETAGQDISPDLQNLIVNSSLNTTLTAPTVRSLKSSASGVVTITYQYTGCSPQTITRNIGDTLVINYDPTTCPTNSQSYGSSAPVTAPNWFSGLFAGNGGSGTLISSVPDASISSVVKATAAPLSSGGEGGYGMQWWMFIKDWNYGFGKDKQVLSRADPTNTQILNPSVSLHPTDNSLRVTVSVFPDDSGGSSKTQPAPAGHSGATDDVFVCEVPNLPLQDWFSVSMTVFGRNLDIYIDGKLVKSCFLPGIPKPASGDITMAGNGGFSGSLCNFNHYSRMLTPADASAFYSAGTSCKSSTGPTTASTATGYSVKFGMYDTVGKKIQEYTF